MIGVSANPSRGAAMACPPARSAGLMGGGMANPQVLCALAEFENESGGASILLLKLKDTRGSLHRVRCEPADGWAALRRQVEAKAGDACAKLLYRDEDGDHAAIDSDETLLDAAAQAQRGGENRLAVTAIAVGAVDVSDTPSIVRTRPLVPSNSERPEHSAVTSFLGGLIAASSLAVGTGLLLAAKAAKR